MERAAFLRQLRLALVLRLPAGERHAIIDDYEGFFADRIQEGKTEAEACREFGSPRTVARNILREEGRDARPLGLLVLLWTALAGYLNWWGTWETFRFADGFYAVLYGIQLALIPLLWLLWRRALTRDPGPSASKNLLALFFCGGAVAWATTYGYALWGMFVWVPRWQALPPEAQTAGGNMGYTLVTIYGMASAVLVGILFAALLLAWIRGAPRYLLAAVWCLGLHCSLNRQQMLFRRMDVSAEEPLTQARWEVAAAPLVALAVVGLGGVLLTAFLLRRGGRHGRAA